LISRLGEEELDLLASQVEAEKVAVIDGVLSAVAGERGAVLEVAVTLFELLRVYRGRCGGGRWVTLSGLSLWPMTGMWTGLFLF